MRKRARTVAIDVLLSFNFAVVFNLNLFPFPPSESQFLGDDPMNRQNTANFSTPLIIFVFCVMERDRDSEGEGDGEGDEDGEYGDGEYGDGEYGDGEYGDGVVEMKRRR
jgi:hypothetical protein